MNTLTNKDKLALQVSLALVAGMFSLMPVAQGAPVLKEVVTGGAKVYQTDDGAMTAVVPDANATGVSNNVINWQDFSVGSSEKVIFDAHDAAGSGYDKTNNYLNVVTGNGTSYVNGAMKGGNHVYLVNPNGIIMGENADVDVGNLYLSTKALDPNDFIGADLSQGASVLGNTSPQAEVVNMGTIQANSVYAEGTEVRFFNTKDVQYKAVSDTSDTSGVELPPLSSTSNTSTNSGVKLKGTNYVHVGYEATAKATGTAQTADANGQYYSPDGTYAASTLGYVINGSAYAFNAGVNDYDYALVRNDYELQNMNSNKKINYMLSLKGTNTDIDTIDLSEHFALNEDMEGGFTPVGDATNPFEGKFDGNFYKISDLAVVGYEYAGLFGYTKNADIKNVGIVNPKVYAGSDVATTKNGYGGAIAGLVDHTTLENVYSVADNPAYNISASGYSVTDTAGSETFIYEGQAIGGLVGKATNGTTIKNAYNATDVLNGGGIVGMLNGGSSIENAYNTGNLVNLIDDSVEEGSTAVHYGIADDATGASSIKNVYNTGKYIPSHGASETTYDSDSASVGALVPTTNNGIITNGYTVETTISDGVITAATITPVGTNSAVDTTSTDGLLAKSYGFFSADESGNAKQSSDAWRIYDKHSLPLLRSFLRANGNGTIPVSFDLNLYADDSPDAEPANNTPIPYNSNEVVYNGYYIGATNVRSDTSRGITSGIKTATSGRIKNADESFAPFYSDSQNGYDIADSTISITKRNIVPPYDMTINKVYDGTPYATDEMRAAFGTSDSAVDVADYYNRTGILVETGLVKTSVGGVMTAENVSLSGSAVSSATYYTKDTDISNAANRIPANYAVNVSQAPDAENAVPVHVTWNSTAAIDTTSTSNTDGDSVLDYANYDFDVSAFIDGTNTVTGYITPRPIYVQLQTAEGLDKVYDSTDNVVYKEEGWASAASNVKNVSSVAGQALGLSDYGVVSTDNAVMSVADPYYTNGTERVSNAGTGYTANYAVTFTSSNANFEKENYEIYSYTPATETTAAGSALLTTDDSGSFLMTGTGKIDQRTVYTTNAELNYQDPDTEAISAVDYRKTYDYTTAYNEANHVDFNTTGGTVSVEDAVAQTYTTGVISGDTITFSLVTSDDPATTTVIENGPTFYKSDKTNTANEVADAAYVGYYVKVGGNSAGNYKFASGTADNPGEEITLDAGNNMRVFHEGGIDRRDLYLTLNQSTGIDKTYDGDANLVDSATRAYASHTDNSNIGNVTYTNSSLEKIAADGTAWNISAAYQLTGNEGAAKNVRKVDGEVVENGKNINYAVSLTGEYADNYTLHVGDSADGNEQDVNGTNPVQFTATGKIAPVTINKVTFAGVSKKYDGTSAVGEVNGATQTDNYITINGVTDANGHSVLVGEETLQDIFGDNIDANGKYTGSVITGTYGNTVAYRAGDTSQFSTTNDQNEEIAQHVNPTKGSNTDYTRYVKYEHLGTAMVNDNYELADSTQYGTGVINPLTVTSLAYGNIGSAEKVYDGTSNLIGAGTAASPTTYKVTYNANGTVESATALDATEGATLVGTLMGSNSALGVSDIPLSYTVNGDSYFAKNDETATANATDATKVVYKLTVADASGYGDYTLGAHADTTYSNVVADGSDGVAVISGSGSITPRHVFVDGETQTKTYDGGTAISANGSEVVSMSAQSGQTAVTGLLSADEDKNNSTAVYHADAGQGYGAKDANWDTNTNALFRNDDKTVRFTPSLSANGTNYVFYHDGSEVTGTFDTTGHIIEQRDLQVTFDDIAKTFDENDYVKTNGEHQVTLTTGSGSAVFAPLIGDTVTITTQNTSQFLPLDSGNAISSTYAGTHDVRYDLVVSGADYRNYRLVDGNNNVLTTGTNASGDATATGKGSGTINAALANTAAADFEAINKVYDGNTNVTYTHTATGGYDPDQVGSDDSYHVNGLTIGTYTLNADQYSILSAIYDSADVGDNRYATYTFQITDTNFTNNVDLSGLGNTDSYHYNATDHTFTLNNNNGSITAKNIYATLTDQYVNPTKAYDNNTTVLNAATKGDNGSTINQTVANSYVTIDGFRSEDTNLTVTPTYLNENVQADGNEVRYDIAVSNNYKLYTGTYDNRSEDQYLTGAGTINPREISLAATNVATKTYDTTADVKMTAADGVTVPTFTVATGVDGESFTIATSGNNAIVGTYGNYDSTDGFTANANVALNDDDTVGYKAVKYTNVLDALTPGANTLMSNYTLVSGNGGVYSADDGGTVTFATGKGQINKLGVNGITANVDSVSKVYDGTDAFTYNHTEADGYVGDQIKQVTDAESTVNNNVVLHLTSGGTLNLDYGYTINEGNNKTRFNFTDAGTGTVTYNFTVSRDVLRSFDLTGISADSDGTYSFDKTDGLGTIEAKDIKVTMSSAGTAANPTKEYDGTTNVLNVSFDAAANNATVDQTQAKSYVTANGFVNGETYTVAAAYTDENVIRDAANEVQTGAHTVTYTVSTDSNNYRLVDADLNADASGNVSLTGIGTITPKEVTFRAGYTQKTYDDGTSTTPVDAAHDAEYQAPVYSFAGMVNGETLTLDDAYITGTYVKADGGSYTPDAHVEATLNSDGSVASVDYKAVQYEGLNNAFAHAGGTGNISNYVLAGAETANGTAASFDADSGKAIYGAGLENGKILRRVLNAGDIETEWKAGAEKIYDRDAEVNDHTNWFSIHTNSASTSGVEYQLAYDLGSGGAKYIKADGTEVKDVGDHYLKYDVAGLSGSTVVDFDISGITDGAFTQVYTSIADDVTGKITPYTIRGDVTNGNIKTYDGTDAADASYFSFNADDVQFMRDDNVLGSNASLTDLVNVGAKYTDSANASIDPYLAAANAPGNRTVTYTLTDTTSTGTGVLSNYQLESASYTGTGDIRQREVYVVDNGGEVIAKTYDGNTNWPTDAESTPGSRFALVERDDTAKTGIVEGEENIVLNKGNITGAYEDANVARENGAVVNTAVKYQDFELKDDGTEGKTGILSNYYLTTKDSTGTATLTGEYGTTTDVAYGTENNKIVITETKGGRITPKEIAVNVVASPEKVYDRNTDVTGDYAKVGNLAARVDGNDLTVESSSDNVVTFATGIKTDEVKITLNDAQYKDKNASTGDKVSYYSLSWDNGNYDLTGASGDTLERGYDAGTGTLTGTLTDSTGTINPRRVDVVSVGKAVKTYDGDANVTSNPTFTIDKDDQKLLDKDGLGSSLSIDGTYADKNANIYPSEYSEEAEGGKSVNYTLSWNGGDEQERKNYKFAASDDEEYDFTGKGDILRRAVYVQDDGGKVLTKTYDGNTDLPANASLKDRFSLEKADDDTGVIDSSVNLKKDAIIGSYVNKDVARDYNGKVINTAVEFQGFELEGTLDNNGFNSKDNYYLAARNDTGTAPLTKSSDGSETDVTYGTNASGGILIKEEKGGRINPKKITVNVIESPEKEYDRTKDVADAYKAVDNLAVNVDGNILDGTADDNALTVKTGINADEVKITLNDAQYKDKNASKGDKVSNYSLSWNNGNYVLAGESTDATGVSGDTFKNKGYDADTENFTGTLTDYTGTINPRLVTVTSVDNVEKIYDGTDAVTSAPSFTIADDDKDILKKDKLYSSLDIYGTYGNKKANIDPDAEAAGGKNVEYALSWNDGTEHSNYTFAANGEADYVGKGDIRRRKVYVVDNGGDIFAKTYDGGKSLPEGADLFDRFTLADKDETAETGIIDSDVVLKNDAVKGAYVDKNVARDDSGKVINKGVKFTGFELTDSNTENGNDAGNYYLTYKDSTGTIPLSGSSDETESIVNYETGTKGITITEAKGGRIEPKNVTISVKKSPTKVYDASELVTGSYDDDGTEVTYASASNLEAAADGANVSRSFGNTNQVTFELDYDNGNTDKFTVSIKGDPAYEDKNVSRDKDGSVLKDKITTYNLSWTNGNYNLVGETTATTPGQEQDTFTADGNEGYTEGNKKRTGVLKDYAGEITPYKLKVKGMDSSKTYDRTVNADSPEVTATFDKASTELINTDMAGSGNVQDFLGLTVKRGTYGAPTEAAKSKALKGGKATEAEIAEAENQDAAFNRTADPFQHQVSYSGIAITNGNYEIDEEFDGTGTINRATVTAKAGSATITAGDDMPVFTGTLEGFVAGEPDVTYTVTETVTDADGNTTTVEKEVMVPYDEYYKERIYWGPDANVRNYSVGEHSVYGWYRREEVATDQDGNKVYNYYLEKETNLDKNYTLTQEPGTFTVKQSSGGGGSSGGGSSTPAPVAPAPEPVISKPVTVTETVNPEPVVEPVILDIGYVDQPIVADGSVYKNVSKDTSNVNNYEANASIQYGSSGTGTDSSENGTIAIDRAEVVNLLGGDVASDGTMSIANTGSSQELSVESTEEGYLSVGTNGKDGSIGIEIEDEKTDFEGTIGIEMEEKEGTIGLETEDGTLLDTSFEEGLAYEEDGGTSAGNRSSRISLKSGSKDGEAEIVADNDRKLQFDNLHQDDEDREDDDKEESEESEEREGSAAITYNDVA